MCLRNLFGGGDCTWLLFIIIPLPAVQRRRLRLRLRQCTEQRLRLRLWLRLLSLFPSSGAGTASAEPAGSFARSFRAPPSFFQHLQKAADHLDLPVTQACQCLFPHRNRKGRRLLGCV